MAIIEAARIGDKGNKISKQITGTSEVSVERSAIATGASAALATVAGEAAVIGTTVVASALGTGTIATAAAAVAAVAAPVVVPFVAVAAGFGLLFSLFDD